MSSCAPRLRPSSSPALTPPPGHSRELACTSSDVLLQMYIPQVYFVRRCAVVGGLPGVVLAVISARAYNAEWLAAVSHSRFR
jgi:hypothetical protein